MAKHLFTLLFLLTGGTLLAQTNQLPQPSMYTPPAQNMVTETKTDYNAIGAPMPPFIAIMQETVAQPDANTRYNYTLLTDKQVKNKANLFVMLFSPVCEHCEDQSMLIEKNFDLFKKSKIVLMCGKQYRQYLNNFLLITHKKDYPQMNVGVDSTDFMKKTMLYTQLPQINIYDHDRKLLKIYSGGVPIDSLKQYIE